MVFCFDIKNNICTQNFLNLYFSCNSMNNLLSYCGKWLNWFKNENFWHRFTYTDWNSECHLALMTGKVDIHNQAIRNLQVHLPKKPKILKNIAKKNSGCGILRIQVSIPVGKAVGFMWCLLIRRGYVGSRTMTSRWPDVYKYYFIDVYQEGVRAYSSVTRLSSSWLQGGTC